MKQKNKNLTAEELLRKLKYDPKYQLKRFRNWLKQRKRIKLIKADQKNLLKDLKQIGYKIDSVWDFVNNKNPHEFLRSNAPTDYSSAYPILVRHLYISHHKSVREGIIRALTEKDAYGVAGKDLIKNFYTEQDEGLKWILSNACKTVIPLKKEKRSIQKLIIFIKIDPCNYLQI